MQFPADMFTFTKEILNGKLHFLCSAISASYWYNNKIMTQQYFACLFCFAINGNG